jgi:hypothetical protein
VNTPAQGWLTLAAESESTQVFPPALSNHLTSAHIVDGKPYWRHTLKVKAKDETITWLLAGTLPDWGGAPLALVITLEEDNVRLANYVADELMSEALNQ